MSASCRDCRFFGSIATAETPNEPRGHCNRHAPRPVLATNEAALADGFGLDAFWPIVYCDNWCGEWRPKGGSATEWPTWDELVARPEMQVKGVGTLARNAIACARSYGDDALKAMTVEDGVGHGRLAHVRNFGQGCLRLVRAAVDGWRADRERRP